MHEVRVYQNLHEGTLWWAEDDLGFTGGADRLADLVTAIHTWAEAEGVLDDLAVRLVAAQAEPHPRPVPVKRSEPAEPLTYGTEAVQTGFALSAV